MIVVRRVKHKESIASFSGGYWDWDKDVWVEDPKYSQTNPKTAAKSGSNSKAVLAGLAAAGLVGAGAYFLRRRRSKTGKMIIEQVRR